MNDITYSIQNTIMHQRLDQLAQLSGCTGILGYAIVRNIRTLSEACKEYLQMYQQALIVNTNKDTEEVNQDSLATELKDYAFIEHDVRITQVPMLEACAQLTAEQMLAIGWMLVDEEEPCEA